MSILRKPIGLPQGHARSAESCRRRFGAVAGCFRERQEPPDDAAAYVGSKVHLCAPRTIYAFPSESRRRDRNPARLGSELANVLLPRSHIATTGPHPVLSPSTLVISLLASPAKQVRNAIGLASKVFLHDPLPGGAIPSALLIFDLGFQINWMLAVPPSPSYGGTGERSPRRSPSTAKASWTFSDLRWPYSVPICALLGGMRDLEDVRFIGRFA
jgi:hypothetical protein